MNDRPRLWWIPLIVVIIVTLCCINWWPEPGAFGAIFGSWLLSAVIMAAIEGPIRTARRQRRRDGAILEGIALQGSVDTHPAGSVRRAKRKAVA